MLDKSILDLMNKTCRQTPEQMAHTRARICSGPVFVEKDGKRVFSREKTNEAYNKMYNIFLNSSSDDND